ncbi:hypothetical protein PPYR_09543 [Photinus pyralis]|uniref:Uncharacterized protein n=1 Tax=Photinus pyralis TaxID=7054 RepID=A0A5N4AMI2_PHOPY|nr:hypothetical protein PPYR_09543 [Photinus pyralis]
MAYAGVEFADDNAVALICSSWLTPRKKHLYWPPYQSQDLYDKALRKNEHHVESWVQYSINRCFFFCGKLLNIYFCYDACMCETISCSVVALCCWPMMYRRVALLTKELIS